VVHGTSSLPFLTAMFSSSHPSLALPLDNQTRVRYAGQPARSPPYSSRLPTAARSARSAPRLPPPYILPAKDSALLLLPAEKKRSRFEAPRHDSGGGTDEGGEYGGKWPRSKTQKLLITRGLIIKGRRRMEDAGHEGTLSRLSRCGPSGERTSWGCIVRKR